MERFEMIPIKDLIESSFNPRKHFDEKQMAELVESIKKSGILTPLLVRWIDVEGVNLRGFQIAAGHRRLRAAKIAGVKELPCIVREMTDNVFLEVMTIENLQRADLHPLDEAEGYRQLMDWGNYTADDIALKVGKSRTYVYSRLKLVELPEKVKKAVWDNKLSHSIALLIARIPDPQLAEKCAQEVMKPRWHGEPMSFREAKEHIHDNYMLAIKDAPFSTKDAQMDPIAGACTTCPKRTGNQKELFDDIKNADVCTDPVCFQNKKKLHQEQLIIQAKEKGQNILSLAESKKLFPHEHSSLSDRCSFIDLKETCYEGNDYKPWGKLLGKNAPEPVLAIDSKGEIHQLVPKKEAYEALKKAGFKLRSENDTWKTYQKNRAKKERQEKIERQAVITAVVESAEKMKWGPELCLWLAKASIYGGLFDVCKDITARRGLKSNGGPMKDGHVRNARAWDKVLAGLTPSQLQGFLVEAIITSRDYEFKKQEKVFHAFMGVDAEKIKKTVIAAKPKKGKKS